jgi:hypothetical protein
MTLDLILLKVKIEVYLVGTKIWHPSWLVKGGCGMGMDFYKQDIDSQKLFTYLGKVSQSAL